MGGLSYNYSVKNENVHFLIRLLLVGIIVFCVQPFYDADMYLRKHIIALISKLKQKGITVVILAVNLEDSLVVADRLIIIENGQFRKEYDRSVFHHIAPAIYDLCEQTTKE